MTTQQEQLEMTNENLNAIQNQAQETSRAIEEARSIYRDKSYQLFFKDPSLGVEIYMSEDGIYAQGWRGRAVKPAFNYRFRNQDHTLDYLNEFINAVKKSAAEKQKAKQAQKAERDLEVGDVLVSSWGYDQTNIDYYQVVGLVGQQSVMIREIACASESDGNGGMSGICTPVLNVFVGEPFTKVVKHGTRVRLSSFSSAYKKEYQLVGGIKVFSPDRWTSYA